jgi:hypothetical protein
MTAQAHSNSHGCFGCRYYLLFPRATPPGDSEAFKAASEMLPSLEAGGGRTAGQQAGCQMLALVLTLIVALTGGALTGKSTIS